MSTPGDPVRDALHLKVRSVALWIKTLSDDHVAPAAQNAAFETLLLAADALSSPQAEPLSELREALTDAIEQLEGWVSWKCPAKHKAEHEANIERLRAALASQPPAPEAPDPAFALENCRLYAARHRREEWAEVILRFCRAGGATGSPLRAAPEAPTELHPATNDLVDRFAVALKAKLAAAEKKYGYSDGWASPDWMDECRAHLREHVEKGDPRDVAAYCAFLWHHGQSTAAPEAQREPTDEWREKLTDALAEIVRLRLRLGDDPHAPLSSEAAVPQTHANIGKRRYSEAWCLVAAARELASESDPTATIGPVGPPSPQNDWREALEAAENAIDDCHDWRSHHHHEALAKVRAALAAVPQSEPLTDRGRMLKLTADEVAEYGALCVANSQRKITAREALEEYFEYHPEAAARQVAQTATPQGDQFEYVGYVDDGDVLKYGDAPANNSCHVYRKLGPVIDLANPGRPRMAILKDMLDRGEITAEQYRREERGEASESKAKA